ncbi:MAG TPA: RNA methyltransferase [Solirubrobacteraceae bacterium]|jgi:TrmH family RNA methyltransferase|nr:RNA methyltransferase [Solirubrobacteraceae bacterium]
MTQIASPQNPRLKALRKLAARRERARSGRFLAEGEDLVAAAERAGFEAVEGFRLAGTGLGGEGFHDVQPGALAAASTLGSASRVIGVYEQRWAAPAGPLCVYLHGVSDPGNVGTIVRSAQAFGASSVALGPRCADPWSPKAVRASMGAIFAVPLARVSAVDELPGERVALLAGAREILRHAEGGRPVSLLVGSERDGLPADVIAACERSARIPISSESLNAAMAATVALYEMTRGPSRVTAS